MKLPSIIYLFIYFLFIFNMDDVIDSCNAFFVSVGPNLAEKIPDAFSSEDWDGNFIDRNPSSVFLTAVEEK